MNSIRLVLKGGDVVFTDGVMHDGVVIIEDTTIKNIEQRDSFKPLESDRIIDCTDNFICPGFVDLHNQGGKGYSVMDGTFESVCGLCRAHAGHGTTGLLLTPLIEEHTFSAILPKLAAAVGKDTGGACVLGIHAEGPFTNPERRGFMPLNAISAPDMKLLDDILEFGGGKIIRRGEHDDVGLRRCHLEAGNLP